MSPDEQIFIINEKVIASLSDKQRLECQSLLRVLGQVVKIREAQNTQWGSMKYVPPDIAIRAIVEALGNVCASLSQKNYGAYRNWLLNVSAIGIASAESMDNHGI